MFRIFIATSSFAEHDKKPIDILKNANFKITFNKTGKKINTQSNLSMLKKFDGIIAGTELYNKEVLLKLNYLKTISRLGVGLDNIDINFAKEKKINIFKTNTTPAPAVAELSLGLILDLSRKISFQNYQLKKGFWRKEMGSLLQGKTLGIIGLGTIGKSLVSLVQGFNLKILAYDIFTDNMFAKKYNIEFCSLNDLLSKSNIISVHLNLSKDSYKILNEKRLKKINNKAILINTSRGEIIDEKALFNLLKQKKIYAAGLDVFNNEPYHGELSKLENVILTPHIGSYAKEIRVQMEIEAAKNLIKGLKL